MNYPHGAGGAGGEGGGSSHCGLLALRVLKAYVKCVENISEMGS